MVTSSANRSIETGLPNDISRDFAGRLNDLIGKSFVKDVETGEVRPLTAGGLHEVLAEIAPDVSASRRHIYRIVAGEALPRLDMIVALARVFNVSPRELIPESVPDDDIASEDPND